MLRCGTTVLFATRTPGGRREETARYIVGVGTDQTRDSLLRLVSPQSPFQLLVDTGGRRRQQLQDVCLAVSSCLD